MKYQFEIEAGERLVFLRYSGQLTVEGLKQSLDELERHPDFDPGFDFIADYSDAKLVDSPGDDHRIAEDVSSRSWTMTGRRVMIARHDSEFGKGRRALGLLQLDHVNIVRTEQDAREWLSQDQSEG